MIDKTVLGQAIKSALALGAAGSLTGAGVALAQTAAPAASTSSAQKLSEIVVTGSHIPRTSIATSQPVITISRQQIEATGFTSLGEILQNLSQAGASFNPQDNFFIGPYSTGFESINLKNLGSGRVLILVNGHRWIPTLFGAVDLSSIPASVIQRVEVLLDGASAIYGSDAVSGVINVITTKNFNGAQAQAQVGMYDAHGDGGGWDGKTQNYSFTVGNSSDRSSVLLTAGYREFDPIWAGNRNISKEPLIGYGRLFYTSFTPDGYWQLGNPSGSTVPPALASCFVPQPAPRDAGCSGPLSGPNANPHQFTDADRVNYAPQHYLADPSEDWYGYAQGHYDLSDNVTYSAEFMFRDRTSTQIISPTPMKIGVFGYWYANGMPIGISATNPYNPFNADLVPALSTGSPTYAAWCAKYGTGAGGGCTANADLLYGMNMNPLALGYRTAVYDSATWYFRNGLNGYFQLGNNEWNWDVTYGFGRNRVNTTLSGIQNTVDLQNALGPLADCSGSCVPLDFFGGQSQISPAQAAYVDTTLHNQAGVTQRDYEADVGGHFFNSWYAGPWGVAAGYEYLEQDGYYSPSPVIATGNVTSNAFNPTKGRVKTDAQYAELNIPLASDLPLAKKISVDIANRWSQFKVDGGTGNARAHASTGRVGFKWQPINSLLLRGTWSQSFREPSISELFGGQSTSYNNVVDPCINASGAPPYPGCPNPSPTAGYGQIPTIFGGNPGLEPEQATSRQVGFVWSPRFVEGLDISADYYKVEVTRAVGTIPEQVILNSCYQQQIQSYCNLITRTGPYITKVLDLNLNTGSLKTNGWDLGVSYRFPTTSVGQFRLTYSANFVKDFVNCNVLTSTTSSCTDYAGRGTTGVFQAIPKERMNASLDWSYGPWSATWSVELIGKMHEPCAYSGAVLFSPPYGWCSNYDANSPTLGVNTLGTTVYHDVQVNYTVASWNTTFTFGINNLFQKDPPISMDAFNDNYLWYYYRIPGRFVYGRISVNF